MKILWRVYKYLALTVFTLGLVSTVTVLFFSFYQPKLKHADSVVVLGAAINTPALYNRSLKGLEAYQESGADVMVLSGGRISDKDISEAQYMDKVIQKNSSSTVPVLMDDQSHNTYENLKNTRLLVPNAKSIVVVSDEFHLARGVLLAKREGFADVYWAAPLPSYYKKSELAYYYIREIVALVAYIPKFIFG